MAVSITALKAGDVVYDRHREKAGNTTMRRWGLWTVRIIEVNAEEGWVLASWNSNPPKKYRARAGKLSWRRSKPAVSGDFA